MSTESKTEILPKIGATLGEMPNEISKLTKIKVDVDNADENKTTKLTGIDEVGKIAEQSIVLTVHDDDVRADGANSVAEEVIVSSVDAVLDTSIADTRSWEVVGED